MEMLMETPRSAGCARLVPPGRPGENRRSRFCHPPGNAFLRLPVSAVARRHRERSHGAGAPFSETGRDEPYWPRIATAPATLLSASAPLPAKELVHRQPAPRRTPAPPLNELDLLKILPTRSAAKCVQATLRLGQGHPTETFQSLPSRGQRDPQARPRAAESAPALFSRRRRCVPEH